MQSTYPHTVEGSTSKVAQETSPGISNRSITSTSVGSTQNNLGTRPLLRLGGDLIEEIKTLIRQEIALVKKELGEKVSFLARTTAVIGVGAGIAYAGAIVLLIGLGFLVAWAIRLAGIAGLFAAFLGLAGIGLAAAAAGGALIMKGISALKSESLAPERTIHTLQELRGGPAVQPPKPVTDPQMPKPSSAEMQSRVEATEEHIGETLEAMRERLRPRNINARIKRRIQVHPYRSGLLAIGAGLAGGFAFRRRFHRA